MNGEKVIEVFNAIANRINKEKLFLTELDNVIGDGDHGINLDRGFEALKEKLATLQDKQISNIFKTAGMTLVSTVGGASGPLYGTMFLNMGKAMDGKEELTISDFIDALSSGIDGVAMRGKAVKGEKTMLDAMIPALEVMKKALGDNKNVKDVLDDGVKAALSGVEYTKTIIATKGRASYLGEKSIGHQDPGATSFSMMLEEVKGAI